MVCCTSCSKLNKKHVEGIDMCLYLLKIKIPKFSFKSVSKKLEKTKLTFSFNLVELPLLKILSKFIN